MAGFQGKHPGLRLDLGSRSATTARRATSTPPDRCFLTHPPSHAADATWLRQGLLQPTATPQAGRPGFRRQLRSMYDRDELLHNPVGSDLAGLQERHHGGPEEQSAGLPRRSRKQTPRVRCSSCRPACSRQPSVRATASGELRVYQRHDSPTRAKSYLDQAARHLSEQRSPFGSYNAHAEFYGELLVPVLKDIPGSRT